MISHVSLKSHSLVKKCPFYGCFYSPTLSLCGANEARKKIKHTYLFKEIAGTEADVQAGISWF